MPDNAIKNKKRSHINLLLFGTIAAGIFLNIIGGRINGWLGLPFYFDNVGTILTACVGGYLPSIVVSFFSHVIVGWFDTISTYYCFITVLIALAASFLSKRGFLSKFPHILLAILVFAFIGGGLGSLLTWFLYGFGFGSGISVDFGTWIQEKTGMGVFAGDMLANFLIDIGDKTITVLIAVVAWKLLPDRFLKRYEVFRWQKINKEFDGKVSQRYALRTKVVIFVAVITTMVSVATAAISVVQYHNATIEDYQETGEMVTEMMADLIEPRSVDMYIRYGRELDSYRNLETTLNEINASTPEVRYMYYYQIREDGAHVVMDLDVPDIPGNKAGDLVELDDYMQKNLDRFLEGEAIEPDLSNNEEYGELLTVYHPVFNDEGELVCYAMADMSMAHLRAQEFSYIAKSISLFIGFLIMVLVIAIWIADRSISRPINSITRASESFAYDSTAARKETLKKIDALDIYTGDEIECLYNAIRATTSDTVSYIDDIQSKTMQITKLQNGLILVLADMVESRDQCTGDHVRKTAAFVRVIMNELKKEGKYADVLTDEYIEDVVNSAPLHDIGKIKVSDTILNKPGKLTDEEFKIMQSHTTAGAEVITQAMNTVSGDTGYLYEARNLAHYHHEKWNGKGYPEGLKGEEIPLSARVMAVADVFDALVSRRSYKEPFSIEKALSIIKEDAGSHFDPVVAEAFLNAEEEVRRIAAMNMENVDTF